MSLTDYRQWLRKFRLLVAGIDASNLRCAFSIEKSLDETPNYSEIVVTNPALSTISQISPGAPVILEAGYVNGNFGLVFSGEVVQPYIEKEGGVDTNLVLVCQDGDLFLNSAFTAKTLEKESTLQDVVDVCSGGQKRGIISDKISEAPPFIRGKVLFGKSADYLKYASYATECQFYMEDEEINIISERDYRPGAAVELNPDTGLVGDPSQTDNGVSAKCLLNPAIKLNTLVHISSDAVVRKRVSSGSQPAELAADGVYRVVKLKYTGDTHGAAWYCEFEAIIPQGDGGGSASGAGSSGSPAAASGGSGGSASVLSQIWRR